MYSGVSLRIRSISFLFRAFPSVVRFHLFSFGDSNSSESSLFTEVNPFIFVSFGILVILFPALIQSLAVLYVSNRC